MAKGSERIVIYRLGSLGDTIVALPCFNKIVECYPDAERIALTNIPVSNQAASLQSILRPGGFIHDTVDYRIGTRSVGELAALRKTLWRLRADTLIYLGVAGQCLPSTGTSCFFGLAVSAGSSVRPQPGSLVTAAATAIPGFLEHEGSRLARCLAALGPIDPGSRAARDLRLTAAEREKGMAVIYPLHGQAFFAVNTGGKLVSKDWGTDKWRELMARLSPNLPLALVFVGSGEDRERATALARLWRRPVINMCGELTPRETAALLSHATFFIGHDSGPLHLAAAMGTRCIGLYGENNRPNKWHPIGTGHIIFHSNEAVGCIRPVDVERAALRLMTEDLSLSRIEA